MLPRIPEAQNNVIPYHAFSQELLCRKTSRNNFTKLKLMKEFLDDEQYDDYLEPPLSKKASSECKVREST